jgi:hypothetical protein
MGDQTVTRPVSSQDTTTKGKDKVVPVLLL